MHIHLSLIDARSVRIDDIGAHTENIFSKLDFCYHRRMKLSVIRILLWGLQVRYTKMKHSFCLNLHQKIQLNMKGLKIFGRAINKTSIISFNLDGIHPHDLGTFLDRAGVAVRVGHHCAQPVMDRFEVAATARASFGMYNTHTEVDALICAIEETRKFFS